MAATALAMLTATAQQTRFCIAQDSKTAPILVDTNDWKGVIRAAQDLGDDVRKVTGTPSEVPSPHDLRIQGHAQPDSLRRLERIHNPRLPLCSQR